MDGYFRYLIVLVIVGGVYFCVDNYTTNMKAQKALELGYQECSELDSYGHTIILYKKECK